MFIGYYFYFIFYFQYQKKKLFGLKVNVGEIFFKLKVLFVYLIIYYFMKIIIIILKGFI